jgi:hypothetical protein
VQALAAIPYTLLPLGAMIVAGSAAVLLVGQVTAAGSLIVHAMPIMVGWLCDRTVSLWAG